MPILANIVSSEKISVSKYFNVVESMNDIIHGLPTLIIGFDYVNKHFSDFDITKPKINDDLYWTFKRTEKRDKSLQDLNWFVYKVFNDLVNNVKYVFVDPIQYNKVSMVKIVKKILSLNKIFSYIHKDMIYLYGDGIIFGIDIKLLKYIGLRIDKIKNKIKEISYCFLDNEMILIEYKKTVEIIGNQVRYIPFLYSIDNG